MSLNKKRNIDLADRLEEVLLSGKWIANTNFKAQIEQTDWMMAERKIGTFNTIAALTFHLNYYLNGLLEFLDTGQLNMHDKYSFDHVPATSEKEWSQLRNTFIANATTFVSKVREMDDQLLSAPFVHEKYGDYARNIEGVIEHSYYHLGQVSLLRKWVIENDGYSGH